MEIVSNGKIQKGLIWWQDGHHFEVTEMFDHNKCEIVEEWIAEDTGKECRNAEIYNIADDNGKEYVFLEKYEQYAKPGSDDYSWWARMYAVGADNYPISLGIYEDEEEDTEEDKYIPSATRGDYGPGNPWDAPGMSISDFI